MGNAGVKGGFTSTGRASERKQHFSGTAACTPKSVMTKIYGPWVGQYCTQWARKSSDASGTPQWPMEGSFNVKVVEGLINQIAAGPEASDEQLRAALLWQLVAHEKKHDAIEKEMRHLRSKTQDKKKEQLAVQCSVLDRPHYEAEKINEEDDIERNTARTIGVPSAPPLPPQTQSAPELGSSSSSVGLSTHSNIAASPAALVLAATPGLTGEASGKAHARGSGSAGGSESLQAQITALAEAMEKIKLETNAQEAATVEARRDPPAEGVSPKLPSLALRRLTPHNSPGLREEEPPVGRLRSDSCKAQNSRRTAESLNPMREVYRAPADVSTQVHYNWGVWDLISLKEHCPSPEQNPDKFIEYFLSSLRAQKANWSDTRVLLQKLIPAAKFRDIMAFWDWGDDLADTPTYPRRTDGSGSIADGLRGDDARTSALVEDIRNAFPKQPPLQKLEKCTFEKDDTAYTYMDKVRDAFSQTLGPSAATTAQFRPFILNHYVSHLPPSVSQKIKATVGWESFSLDTACAHAAHHLAEMGVEKRDKKDRLLSLQIDNLSVQQAGGYKHPSGFHKAHIPYVPPASTAPRHGAGQQMGFTRFQGRPGRGVRSRPEDKPCPRCGVFGHMARFCMAVTSTPGQYQATAQQQAGSPQASGGAQGALNAYAPPFYQPSSSNQQTVPALGHQPQQFRTA